MAMMIVLLLVNRMINNNDLLFLSGNDVPFVEAQITIHQPTIKEIAYIGEEQFFIGCDLINFSKNSLEEQDKMNLEQQTNFDILLAILREHNAVMLKNQDCVLLVLSLLFPEYTINIMEKEILLNKEGEEPHSINNTNFEEFKIIFNKILGFKKNETQEYNPSGELAKKIADKFKQRRKKLAEDKPAKKIDIFNRYVSILAVGEQKNMQDLLNYTVYQLFDEFERYELKLHYDVYLQAKMAGAKDLKDVDDWMKDIHS